MRRGRYGALALLGASLGCYGGVDATADTDASDTDISTGVDETGEGSDETGDAPEPEDVPEGSVHDPLVGRLNHTQYAFAVEDIFGVPLTDDERAAIPRDLPVGSKYSTSVQGQFFSAQYVLAYAEVARSVVDRIGPDALAQQFGGCSVGDAGCSEAVIDGLGLRTHRRPLTDEQRDVYLELVATIEAEATPADAVVGVAEAMLQSPQFLYRIEDETTGEPDSVYQADGYEFASRLSFFLWQSVPDAALLEAAGGPNADGNIELADLGAEIDRMLLDPKFARSRRQFWGDYTLASVAGFAAADPEVREELRESLLASLDRMSGVDAQPQDLSALFTGTDLLMTPAVAELAGATPKGDGLQLYATDEAERRHGVLSHPGFYAALGTTSFVGRGLFLTERVLCQHILPPPSDDATAQAIMDTAMQTEELTPRGASEFRFTLEPICLTCHHQFEPIAYAFERYDLEGRYTLTDHEGRDLFSDGMLPEFLDRPAIPFADAEELFDGLADTETTYRCMVENMMEYSTGFSAQDAEDSVLEAQASFQDEGRTFDALVRAVATSPQLTYKRTAEAQ
ncbi:MAG: DUF1588 domain-containing protein [Myxococcota bacterium]